MRRFLNHLKTWTRTGKPAHSSTGRLQRRLRLERLEDRIVLANIVWANEFDATNTLTGEERDVVRAAIQTWEDIILDFDCDPNNAPGQFDVTIIGGSTSGLDVPSPTSPTGSATADAGQFGATPAGNPSSARIRIDADAGMQTNDPAEW